MKHCQKLGQGRSPSVQTHEQWDWLRAEVHAISPDISALPHLWLAANVRDEEEKWRDAYKKVDGKWKYSWGDGEKLDTSVALPWAESFKDTNLKHEHNCLAWDTGSPDENSWYESECYTYDKGCPCQYAHQPILILRGFCVDAPLDRFYTPKQMVSTANDLILLGQLISKIQYNDGLSQWILSDTLSNMTAVSGATKVSYVLGKHKWTVRNDVFCKDSKPYTKNLKLSGCNHEGDFTCNDGQCITMDKRCNQVPNCKDESDERGCQLVVVNEWYNRKVPPITVNSSDESIIPVPVNISIDLLKVIDMEEQDHKIYLQFQITLEWRENYRVVYHNLKKDKSLNVLSDEDISSVWLPRVYYDNTDQKLVTRLGALWEWETEVAIEREGSHVSCESNPSCERSGFKEIDEIEIFKARENRIEMQQVYTLQFQCQYHLQYYPFDTQVTSIHLIQTIEKSHFKISGLI